MKYGRKIAYTITDEGITYRLTVNLTEDDKIESATLDAYTLPVEFYMLDDSIFPIKLIGKPAKTIEALKERSCANCYVDISGEEDIICQECGNKICVECKIPFDNVVICDRCIDTRFN